MALIYRPAIFRNHPRVRAALTLAGNPARPYGFNMSNGVGDDAERVRANRARLAAMLGFDVQRLAVQSQVHGTAIAEVREGYVPGESDALVTSEPGWLLTASVADCLPVLLYDERLHVVAAVHSGWRGTHARIVEKTISHLEEHYGSRPADLLVYVGAGADQCCYEVGAEFASKFDGRFLRATGDGKFLFDNKGVVLNSLLSLGVAERRIEFDERCTICDRHFHSYRRDRDRSGRMFGVIGIEASAQSKD